MNMVATREMRAVARSRSTYRWRMAAGAFAGLIISLVNVFDDLNSLTGRRLFAITVSTAAVFCLFEGVRKASAALAEEKMDGTLNLLFLTRLSPGELVAGKFVAAALSSVQSTITLAPLLAVSILIGGVSAGETIRALAALLNLALFSVAVGLGISARSKEPVRALFWTWTILALLGCSLFSLQLSPTNWLRLLVESATPLTPLLRISDLAYSPTFWTSIVLTALISGLALFVIARWLGRAGSRCEEPATDSKPTRAFSAVDAPRWFSGNPIEWLSLREMRMHSSSRREAFALIVAAVCILFFTRIEILSIIALAVVVWLTIGSTVSFARARHNRSLELWLTSPLTEKEILDGHIAAIRRVFFAPGALVCVALAIRVPGLDRYFPPVMGFYYVLCFCVLLATTPSIAMWVALKTTSPTRAIIWTLGSTLVMPWLCVTCPILVYELALEGYTTKALRFRLRRLAQNA